MSLWSRFANVFRGNRLSREIDEELQSHIQEAIEQGRDPADARKAFVARLLSMRRAMRRRPSHDVFASPDRRCDIGSSSLLV